MKQLAKILGYSDQLDARVKSVYLITTLIVGTLLGWLLLAILVLHAYDAVPSSIAIIAAFLMIYGMLKQRYFFVAKSFLLLLSFTQMVVSIFIMLGTSGGVYNILYLMIPQAFMIYDLSVRRERLMIYFSIVCTVALLFMSQLMTINPIVPIDASKSVVVQLATILTITGIFSVVFFYFALQLSKYYARLKLASEVDSLTGLFNRRSFTEMAAKRFYNGNTSPFALAVFDIDDFKHVNDTWGHPVGDIVLKEMASVIKNHLRTSDFFARIGGEEFALILDVGEIASTFKVLSHIKELVERTTFRTVTGEEIHVTISVGVVVYNQSIKDFDEMFRQVDFSLYHAKRNGKNRIEFYE